MPLPFAPGSTLRKLSVSESSYSSASKTVAERTRKKTNDNEITEQECILVRERIANVRESLTPVVGKGMRRSEAQEMTESYVAQCEKAMETGKW